MTYNIYRPSRRGIDGRAAGAGQLIRLFAEAAGRYEAEVTGEMSVPRVSSPQPSTCYVRNRILRLQFLLIEVAAEYDLLCYFLPPTRRVEGPFSGKWPSQ